jgi:hypothetical protein
MRDSLSLHTHAVSGSDNAAQDDAKHRRSRLTAIWNKYKSALTLFGLGALAVSQPILSDLRAGAGYFVARRVGPLDIVVLVLVITLAPGAVANLLVWFAAISKKLGSLTEASMVGIFVTLLTRTVLLRTVPDPRAALLIPIAIGTAVAVTYYRSEWLRDGLAWVSPAPLIIAGFFLFTPPVLHLVIPPSFTAVEAGVDSTAPVVFVVFDELPVVSLLNRAGDIDADRYPNFAALAGMSTWYKYTATAHDGTLWAIPALLTGDLPEQSLVPTTANYPGNLFTLLDAAYELNVMESQTYLCPSEMCGGVKASAHFWERSASLIADSGRLYAMMIAPNASTTASLTFNEALAEAEALAGREVIPDRGARFEGFLNAITSEDASLHYAHISLPHIPYQYYPSGRQYLGGSGLDGQEDEVWFDQALADQGYQRQLLQVQYVDRLLGRLIARLEQLEVLDDAMLVVTADHGASFRAGISRRSIDDTNAFETGMVPLFIKAPHQSGGIVDETPARTIDVLPTVAEHLGIELPWPHEGETLTRNTRTAPLLQVKPYRGDPIELIDVAKGMHGATEYAYSVFGDGNDRIDPFALGDYDGLIDRSVGEVSNGPSALRAQVEDLWRLDHVSGSIGFLPGFIRGDVIGDVEPDTHVAIALNRRIRAVVPVLEDADSSHFSAILPEEAFVDGFNELTLMSVTGPIESPKVESIEYDEQHEFQLEPGGSGEPEHLVAGDGRTWELTEEPVMSGYVEATTWYPTEGVSVGTDLAIGGWAVDVQGMAPADRVVFFVDGVYGGSAKPDLERPDIEEGYDDSRVLKSGFRGQVSHFSPAESCELRVFALSGGSAVELEVSERASSTFLGC